jgi:hypothetical protein
MTPHPPHDTFKALRQACLGKIETLKDMTLRDSTLTKLF